jgi:hypothetical protein
MCLSSVMLWSISLCKYFRGIVGVNVGIFLCLTHPLCFEWCGKKGEFSSVLLRWAPLIVLSRNNVRVIGDLIQSYWDMHGMFSDPPCLVSMCFVNPLYMLSSLPLSLRALMSCSPMHVMYAFLVRNLLYQTYLGEVVQLHLTYILGDHILFCVGRLFFYQVS